MTRTPFAGPHDIETTYIHLPDGGAAVPIPVTDSFWAELSRGDRPELTDGRLVTRFSFAEDWQSWERHPAGVEVVMLLSGSADFIVETDGREEVIPLRSPGSTVLVPAGAWHRARAHAPTAMLFITAGRGTEHRPVSGGRHDR